MSERPTIDEATDVLAGLVDMSRKLYEEADDPEVRAFWFGAWSAHKQAHDILTGEGFDRHLYEATTPSPSA